MKIKVVSPPKTIMSNPHSLHNYFGWSTVARLQDGTLATVASGLRLGHVCPFGKVVLSRSRDEGKTWGRPEIVLDTPLDDRDGGICTFGDKGVIVTTFNNTPAFQRGHKPGKPHVKYMHAYLDEIEAKGGWEKYLGSVVIVSRDGGITFGEPKVVPITSPHGPCVLSDGTILYIGSTSGAGDYSRKSENEIHCYKLTLDGDAEYLSEIEQITEVEGIEVAECCEPHAIQLPSGKIIVHIRVQDRLTEQLFTLFQSESTDGGKTFSKPHRIADRLEGAPPHLFLHSSGVLISTYGHRAAPYSIRAIFSRDGGESWEDSCIITEGVSTDLGYPSCVELSDGRILTVYYDHETLGESRESTPAVLRQVIWEIEE